MTLVGLDPAASLCHIHPLPGVRKLLSCTKALMSVKMPSDNSKLLDKPAGAPGQPVSMMRAGAFC